MSKLIFVRHSHPEVTPGIPAQQWHLSKEGHRRCTLLAEQITVHEPEVIVSSTEPKAIETAEHLATAFALPYTSLADLHEHDRSNVGYLDAKHFETLVSRFFAQPDKLIFGSETATQAQQRFMQAVATVLSNHQNKNVVIISHGTVITLFVTYYTRQDPFSFWKSLALPAFVVLPLPLIQ